MRPVLHRLILGALVAASLLFVPDAAPQAPTAALVKVDTAEGVERPRDVVWVLALGSDARPGEPVLRMRADAIQLIGINLRTGRGSIIGIPRDSWVRIPGHGMDKINAAMQLGGPQLMARTVSGVVGVGPDYVFTASFDGFRAMVQNIGGITVHSRLAFTDPHIPGRIRVGRNELNGFQALMFSRVRYRLPRGDFDRSANQQETLRGILRQVRSRQTEPGFMERGMFAVLRHLHTNASPRELYRLAHAAAVVEPRHLRGCVLRGRVGSVGAASVVFPDVAQARRLGNQARRDGTFGRC